MKLNHELIRNLLFKIEDITDGHKNFELHHFHQFFSEIDSDVVDYHLKYLADVGFIEPSYTCIIDITPTGRNFLDGIRNDDIWNKTKSKLQPFGNVTLSVLSEVAKSFLTDKLGL